MFFLSETNRHEERNKQDKQRRCSNLLARVEQPPALQQLMHWQRYSLICTFPKKSTGKANGRRCIIFHVHLAEPTTRLPRHLPTNLVFEAALFVSQYFLLDDVWQSAQAGRY